MYSPPYTEVYKKPAGVKYTRESRPEVGKVTLKNNDDELLSSEFLLKSNGDEALNDVFLQKVTAMKRLTLRKNCSDEAFNAI